jgi:hypothetical protein
VSACYETSGRAASEYNAIGDSVINRKERGAGAIALQLAFRMHHVLWDIQPPDNPFFTVKPGEAMHNILRPVQEFRMEY